MYKFHHTLLFGIFLHQIFQEKLYSAIVVEAMRAVDGLSDHLEATKKIKELFPDADFSLVKYSEDQPWFFQYGVNDPDHVMICLSARTSGTDQMRLATLEVYDTIMTDEQLNTCFDFDRGGPGPKTIQLLATPTLESVRERLCGFFLFLETMYVRYAGTLSKESYEDARVLQSLLRNF